MARFKIYAGLSGGFGGAHYCGVYECKDEREAEMYAREQAVEEYESYGGCGATVDEITEAEYKEETKPVWPFELVKEGLGWEEK